MSQTSWTVSALQCDQLWTDCTSADHPGEIQPLLYTNVHRLINDHRWKQDNPEVCWKGRDVRHSRVSMPAFFLFLMTSWQCRVWPDPSTRCHYDQPQAWETVGVFYWHDYGQDLLALAWGVLISRPWRRSRWKLRMKNVHVKNALLLAHPFLRFWTCMTLRFAFTMCTKHILMYFAGYREIYHGGESMGLLLLSSWRWNYEQGESCCLS